MHVTLVHIHVRPEAVEAFIEATHRNHLGSIKEPGNRRFDVLQDPADPTHFILYEAFLTDADVRAHKNTPHYLEWREVVAGMMAQPRRGEPYRGLYPKA